MKTPITDHATDHSDAFESPAKARKFARRLELDRAALMDFLVKLDNMANDENYGSSDFRKSCRYEIPKVLAAARANFPPSHP
jgi:hypothetical protein